MNDCFLHIGSHKTGTSAIQKFLFESNELSNNNFYYPKSCKYDVDFSHNKLGLSLINRDDFLFKKLLQDLDSEIKENKSKNIIISSEVLEKSYISSEDYLIVLLEFLRERFNVVNLIYSIRDMKDHCNSVFKQFVGANMWNKSAEDFISFFMKITFTDIVAAWSNFENINKIFVYWYSEDFDQNIDNFEKIIKINFTNKKSPGTINKSLDGKFLELQYFYNLLCKDEICEFDENLSKKIRQSNNLCKDNKYYFCNNIVSQNSSKILDDYNFDFCSLSKCSCIGQKIISNKKYDQFFSPPKNMDEFLDLSRTLNVDIGDLPC